MPIVRFKYSIRRTAGSQPSPGGYKLELVYRSPDGDYQTKAEKVVDKLGTSGHFGRFNVSLPVQELSGTDFCLRVTRRSQSGGAVLGTLFRLGLAPTTSSANVDLGIYKFFDGVWSFSGKLTPFPESGLTPDALRVRVEVRSGTLNEEPAFAEGKPSGEFEFEGPRMFLDKERSFEHLLRVFTKTGIDVGRHYNRSDPGSHAGILIRVGRPFLDVWGDFRSTHPRLATALERFSHDPKKAHKDDDTWLWARRYDILQPYQIAEGVIGHHGKGPVGDPDWVWNINLDREYEHLGNDKNKLKHMGLHVEACRSLSREQLPDGLSATDKNRRTGDRVWMLGTHVFDDSLGAAAHKHFELHPLYVMERCMGGWFHFAVFESIALAPLAAQAGASGNAAGWPRTSSRAKDYREYYYKEKDAKHRTEPYNWRSDISDTYRLICDWYRQQGDKAGLARFFAETSLRYDSLGVDSGLPAFPDRNAYRRWALDQFANGHPGEIYGALAERLAALYDFPYGSSSMGVEPVSGPVPQSLLRCVYARENHWAAEATGGVVGEPQPRIALNRATSRRTEVVRKEMARVYRSVFDAAASADERGQLFAEAVLSYRQWAVPTESNTDELRPEELRQYGAQHQSQALARQLKFRIDRFWDELTPYRKSE